MVLNSRPTRRSHRAWLPVIVIASLLAVSLAEAGRRSIRIDLGAWGNSVPITPWQGSNENCPGAGVFGEGDPNFPPIQHRGYIIWNDIYFQTATFYDPPLDSFFCQFSAPYDPGFSTPFTYLNFASFPPEEADLAYFIGLNTNNAVSGLRYSFLGFGNSGSFGRQWVFYFFPDGLTVVGLYGVPDDGSTYATESIIDLQLPSANDEWLLWNSQRDGFSGQYFCFQGRQYIGDCVPPAPPPPEEVFMDGFE
jgi:hypothetical protein